MSEKTVTVLEAEWTPPVVYEVGTDSMRAATQRDVDILTAVAKQYGQNIKMLREALSQHEAWREQLRAMGVLF